MTATFGYCPDYRHPIGPFCIGDPGSGYNGFSWPFRCASTPLQNQGAAQGKITKPRVCGVTGTDAGYVFMHLEDYAKPLAFYPVGRAAHYALHSRFTDPLRWFRLVRKHYVHGAWFTFLTMDPTDMKRSYAEVYPVGLPAAGELWPGVADRLAVSVARFPTSVAQARLSGVPQGNLFR